MDLNIRTAVNDDGVLLARIDMPGRAMNVFSIQMIDSLERLLDRVDTTDTIRAVVLASGKTTFLVGADLEMIRMFTEQARTGTYESLHALCGRLGRLFRRLETSAKPYVAAINGLALGGGLEVTLACHERVVADDNAVQLGLPEIKLGLLPGAGGTQRLPRLIGVAEAMRMLLTGDPVSVERALQLGLVDQVVARDQLIEAARRRALALSHPRAPWDMPGRTFDAAPFDFTKAEVADEIAAYAGVTDYQRARYPAYEAIIKCVIGGWNRPIDEACQWEMDVFVDLIRNPVAGNMVRTLFLNRQRAAKEGQPPKSLFGARVAVAGDGADPVRRLLERSKVPVIDASELTDQDIVVIAGDADAIAGKKIVWLRDHDDAKASAGFWLADPTEHGRSAEVVVADGDEEQANAGRKLGQWLRATVLITRGSGAFLPALKAAQTRARNAGCGEDQVVLAVALAAAKAWLSGGIEDLETADVTAVLAGVHPAYTGGPFTFLRQTGIGEIRAKAVDAGQRDPLLFAVPDGAEALFNDLAAAA